MIVIKSNARKIPSFVLNRPIPVEQKNGKEYIVDSYGGWLELSKIALYPIEFEIMK